MKEKEVVTVGIGEGGREKRKHKKREMEESTEDCQNIKEKFFIDLSKDEKGKELVNNILAEVNSKKFGREIILKDLVLLALPKLTPKDFDTIRANSLSDYEKMEKECFEYNHKNGTNCELGYYFVSVRDSLKDGK